MSRWNSVDRPRPALAGTDAHSGDYAWWGNRGEDSDARLTRQFDLRSVDPGATVSMEAALCGGTSNLTTIMAMCWPVATECSGISCPANEHPLTIRPATALVRPIPGEQPRGKRAIASVWVTEHYDLSDYAGDEVFIRFEYVTDDAVNASGWFVDDIRIPAIDYASDFEQGADGWISEGWLLTDNHLDQRWLVQVMELDDSRLQAIQRFAVDAKGMARFNLDDLGGDRTAVLAISAMAPATTELAEYSVAVDLAD